MWRGVYTDVIANIKYHSPMNSTKYSFRYLVFVFIILCVFAAPFTYRLITFIYALNAYDYQELPSIPKQGDHIKTILTVSEDFHVDLLRESHFTFWKYYSRKDRIVEYKAPNTIYVIDENDNSLVLETQNEKIFNQILDSKKTTEITDSFTLYSASAENGNYVFYEIEESNNGRYRKRSKIDDAIVNQFALNDLSVNIKDQTPPSHMGYEELLEKKAPALLYNQQNQTKGLLVFGVFVITNINPLTVKCVEYISHEHANELKKSVCRSWFHGFELVYWIVFGIMFCIFFFFTIKIINAILRGNPIE